MTEPRRHTLNTLAKEVFGEIEAHSDRTSPYAKALADFGAALFGEDDPRVQGLRPQAEFCLGDWLTAGVPGEYALVVDVNARGAWVLFYIYGSIQNKYEAIPLDSLEPGHFRLAELGEILKIRGEG